MGHKIASTIGFVAGYALVNRSGKRHAAAVAAAEEAGWQQAYAQVQIDQEAVEQAAAQAAAEAVRDEARRDREAMRQAMWMVHDPVGQAWTAAKDAGSRDERLIECVETTNRRWREAWERQCATDGMGSVAPRGSGSGWFASALLALIRPLCLLAAGLFVLGVGAWLINHSIFTPSEVFKDGAMRPKRGARPFWTSGLSLGAYASAGAGLLAFGLATLLDQRAWTAAQRRRQDATDQNTALAERRVERYGFDPLGATLPPEAHWAVLPDGTDPEAAQVLLTVTDPEQRRDCEQMTMEHAQRMQAVADWGGRARADTPSVLPPGMAGELAALRG